MVLFVLEKVFKTPAAAMRRRLMRKVLRAWCGTARELHDARSLAVLEQHAAELEKLQRQSHAALCRVYRNSGREQGARAERGQSGCEACAQNEGISRRCMSPGTEGPPGDTLMWHDEVHAIEVGEHGTRFCRTCRGLEGHKSQYGGSQYDDRHAPAWCGVLEPLRCRELGAR
jgi:hypothetical protein